VAVCVWYHIYLFSFLSYLVAVFLKCAIGYNPTPTAGLAGAFLVYARRLALTPYRDRCTVLLDE
jgi:hypothetical protein